MKKRLFLILLALALTLGLGVSLAAPAAAEEAWTPEDFTYTLDPETGTILLTKYVGTDPQLTVHGSYAAEGETWRTVLDCATVFRGSTVLTSVTLEANRLLADMYNGRFRLAVPAGGSLQLEVEDRDFDVRGSVASLSGGEKFLVALALGIGLANVVSTQHHAVNMDALFIDEGFGSLSDEALDRALDVLNALTEGNRLVGIISHVDKLDESIPQKIRVRHGDKGSSLAIELA